MPSSMAESAEPQVDQGSVGTTELIQTKEED